MYKYGYEFIYRDAFVDVENVLPVMHNWNLLGKRSVLVTLVDTDGSSPRQVGAQMLVREDGEYFGHIADGCLRSEIIRNSLEAIATGQNSLVRYGKDSRYMDITLPCGSGVDLFFDQAFNPELAKQAALYKKSRQIFSLETNIESGVSVLSEGCSAHYGDMVFDGSIFKKQYIPSVKLVILGTDQAALLLAQHGVIGGMDVEIHTPDELLIKAAQEQGIVARQIINPKSHIVESIDPQTAIVFLFHDLDYEVLLLKSLLKKKLLYLGCLGSHRTHDKRCNALLAQSVDKASLQQIQAPLGLIKHTKSPLDLAISIVADIVRVRGN